MDHGRKQPARLRGGVRVMMRGSRLASRATDRAGRVPTILVVDDEPAIRTMVRRMLARLPCVVVEAGDGDEALAYVRREPPDLILLDIVMPRLDGWSVLRTLREDGFTPHIPVVLISGNVVLDDAAAR